MSVLDIVPEILARKKKVFSYIKDNYATDFSMKKVLCSDDQFDKEELRDAIDDLIEDGKIERTYPKDSQVPVYVAVWWNYFFKKPAFS